jgi:PKD domain
VLASPAPTQAIVSSPTTVAGPSSDIVEFGGVAMASDGTGGLVYTKAVEGVPHVFVSRYLGDAWSAPIRADWDQPFEASQARIAAGPKGELLVVWVTQVATVHSKVRYGLFSAAIDRGASSFGPSQPVDPNVGNGVGVDPSLSATSPGQAIVAYRAITNDFDGTVPTTAVKLRPGDVLADIRVAKLKEDRWSQLGAINRNPEASMRPPSPANGPQVGAGTDGNAVVAWQEPDQTGTARIWVRRIFGTTPGPILEASPTSWEGAPVSGDVDAFSLAVTPLDQARIAMRVQPNTSPGTARLLLNTLPAGFTVPSNALVGVRPVFAVQASSPSTIGMPGLAADEQGGAEGLLRLAFVAGNQLHEVGAAANGTLVPVPIPPGPAAVPGAEADSELDPEGGGVVAYPALEAGGRQALAVRQEFPGGAAQLALLSGAQSGPIAGLGVAGSGSGDALIGFRQGEPGHFEIVGDRASAPPAAFKVKGPKRWTRPSRVKLRWEAAKSTVGGLSYAVLIGGRTVKRDLRRRLFRPPPAVLGSGRTQARVLATDGVGQQLLSKPVKLLVDGERPIVALRGPSASGRVGVRILDADSGVAPKETRIEFGDGDRARGGLRFHHVYERPGRYTIAVRASDRAGNRVARRFEVRVP